MIEIERKFRLSLEAASAIRQKLTKKYGALQAIHQVDKVFLLGIGSFKEFTLGMPVVRLRTENLKTKLAFKRAVNKSGDSIEHELEVNDAKAIEAILIEIDFRLVTTVIKDRIEVKDKDMTYALDSVEKLGNFIEIEILAKDQNHIPDAERRIMTAAKELGLTETDLENKKYDQLITGIV